MSKKVLLSDLVKQIRLEKTDSYIRRMIQESNESLFEFTDLTPLTQGEIDLYWTYPGSELQRKIALRLQTRTAEEALKAIATKWSASSAPCHRCGKNKMECDCLVYCMDCCMRFYKDSNHVCSDTIGSIRNEIFKLIAK